MKKFILTLVFCLAAVSLFGKGHFGVVAGVNNSELPVADVNGSGMWQFTGGAAYHYPFALGFAIQPELVFDTKGTNWENNGYKNNFRVAYLELPVQLQWGFDFVLFKPYVFAEPFIGIALAGKYNDQSFPALSEKMVMSDMKSCFEYGIGVGLGFDITRHFQISAKYYWNLEDFNYRIDGEWQFNNKQTPSYRGVAIKLGVFF